MYSLLRIFVYLFLFLLSLSVIILALMFIMSPFSSKRVDEKEIMINRATGEKIEVHVPKSGAPLSLKTWVQTKQLELLEQLTRELHANDVTYWAVKSTLLATVRHGKLMPWDDTVSIAILHKDLRKLVDMRNKLQETGKSLLQHGKHAYFFCTNNFSRFPVIEINIMEPKDHEISVCTPTDELGACSFEDSHLRRNEVFPYADVFPLGSMALGTLAIPIPHVPDTCLTTTFGPNWKTMPLWDKSKVVNNGYSYSLVRRFFPSFF